MKTPKAEPTFSPRFLVFMGILALVWVGSMLYKYEKQKDIKAEAQVYCSDLLNEHAGAMEEDQDVARQEIEKLCKFLGHESVIDCIPNIKQGDVRRYYVTKHAECVAERLKGNSYEY